MLYKRGKVWWIQFYENGRRVRESSESTSKMVAKKLLEKREGNLAHGKVSGVQYDRVTFDDLAKLFIQDYKLNQRKSLVRAERSASHLRKVFGGVPVPRITTLKINEYMEARIDAGAANASINRELAALKRMLNIGAGQTPPMVDRVPKINMLKENNIRKGFFEHDEFLRFREQLPEYLRGMVTFAYKFGWRSAEVREMTWAQVDRVQGIVSLHAGDTKNDEGRTVYLDNELKEIFTGLWMQRKARGILVPHVFPNRRGTGQIKEFRAAWNKGFELSGVGRKLFHDLRRTAVRNMVRAGVPERVAMMISGHKTRSVFDRYNIVSERDLKLAAETQEKYIQTQTATVLATPVNFGHKKTP